MSEPAEVHEPAVTVEMRDNVAVVTINDGKVNALSYRLLSEGRAAFAQAVEVADAIVLAGNGKCLSAGFDLGEVMQGPEQRDAIISSGGDWFYEIFTCPKPVVIACTGHAVAGGVVFLLVGDTRVGRAGAYKVGFNEVLIGVPMPKFGISLTQYRVLPPMAESILLGDMYAPEAAREAGLFDLVVEGDADAVIEAAIVRASELAARPADAYGQTKIAARQQLIERFATEARLSLG
ncbi:MAG: crotonase/enoyl-CoA hydratase family protein [Candidatus Nanopelagicales bacterium]